MSSKDYEAARRYGAIMRLRELGVVPLGREFKWNTDTLMDMIRRLETEEEYV